MVRLSRIARDIPCEVLGKCEYLNPGGPQDGTFIDEDDEDGDGEDTETGSDL